MNVVFPCCANWETFVADTKCQFLNKIRNVFCVPDTKFVSATNVARAGKRGNICVGNMEKCQFVYRITPIIQDLEVNINKLKSDLKNLKPNRASGPDGISSRS